MDQNQLKLRVAQAAAAYVADTVPTGAVIGVGTGSTANLFIDQLAALRERLDGAVASSEATRQRLEGHGIRVLDLNEVSELPVYVDGADELDPGFCAIKGGGAALTREKIVTAVSRQFVCIADASKRVDVLGRFPLPLEVIPMAREHVTRQLRLLGGEVRWREAVVTDNGNIILDVHGLRIEDPVALESQLDHIVGVVCNGLFARRGIDVLLLSSVDGVLQLKRK